MIYRRLTTNPQIISSPTQKLVLDAGSNDCINLGTLMNNARCIQFMFQTPVQIDSGWSAQSALSGRNRGPSNDEYDISFQNLDGGKLRFVNRVGATTNVIRSDQTVWLANTWYEVTCQIDDTNGQEMYINLTKQSNINPATGAFQSITDNSFLGCFSKGVWQLSSVFKNVRIWSQALSLAEITAGFDSIPSATATNLIECFPYLVETGAGCTGIKGNTCTIETDNPGGLTHINNTIRQPNI